MEEDSRTPKKISLLRKFDIGIERLDYSYVRKCKDVKELEKILKILRSGEEGHFPELVSFVEQRLKELDPTNRLLRIQLPVLRFQHLDKEERNDIIQDISEWVDMIGKSSEYNDGESTDIFNVPNIQIPIRGQGGESSNATEKGINKNAGNKEIQNAKPRLGPDRIKSWEYDKWDKFDVEEELTRLDVVNMQTEEWEKVQKPRIEAEQRHGGGVEGLMKNLDQAPPSSGRPQTKEFDMDLSQPPPLMDVSTPSFMEEISEEDKPLVQPSVKVPMAQRRFKVEIEDVHISF